MLRLPLWVRITGKRCCLVELVQEKAADCPDWKIVGGFDGLIASKLAPTGFSGCGGK